jgi:NAD kinase
MKLERIILLIEKETDLEYYTKKSALELLEQEDREEIARKNDNHRSFMNTLERLLKEIKISYRLVKSKELNSVNISDYGLVMTAGGDGTFLSVAKLLGEIPIIGLNSEYTGDNDGSSGGLTTLDKRNINELRKLETDGRIAKWRLLEAYINDKRIADYAVNDIYVGNPKTYRASHLRVKIGNEKEKFICSGVVACTPMGSHAWFKSAGGTQFDNELGAFGFIVREPYEKRLKYKFVSKILSEKENVIVSPIRLPCVVVFNGQEKEYNLNLDDYVTIKLSEKYINVVKFD